ncbi:hypothetical protein [Streptomyces sp. NPDC102462]|uniref:hypothetical protein n=1 Tax=Streptomyces sp. NPDC102462 TaxID=3366178 RepID=UPI003818D043
MTDHRRVGGDHKRDDVHEYESLSAAQVLQARYRSRLPLRLDDLAGPRQGTVELPLHVVWSSCNSYPLESPKARMDLYRVVLAEGQQQDLIDFLKLDGVRPARHQSRLPAHPDGHRNFRFVRRGPDNHGVVHTADGARLEADPDRRHGIPQTGHGVPVSRCDNSTAP